MTVEPAPSPKPRAAARSFGCSMTSRCFGNCEIAITARSLLAPIFGPSCKMPAVWTMRRSLLTPGMPATSSRSASGSDDAMTLPASRTGLPDARRYAVPARLATVGPVLACADLAASQRSARSWPAPPSRRRSRGGGPATRCRGPLGLPAPRGGAPVAAAPVWGGMVERYTASPFSGSASASQVPGVGRLGITTRSRPATGSGSPPSDLVGSPGGGSAGLGATAMAPPAGLSALDRVARASSGLCGANKEVAFGAEMPYQRTEAPPEGGAYGPQNGTLEDNRSMPSIAATLGQSHDFFAVVVPGFLDQKGRPRQPTGPLVVGSPTPKGRS